VTDATQNAPAERKIIVEQNKRFSECMLWKLQREYFDQEGINAWVNQVPFYITSNPVIAKCYAKLILAFASEWVKKNPDAKNHPFYLLELGTGSGRFSYYVVKALDELQKAQGLTDIHFCYIMSDFTKNNIKYHETHPALLPYIEKGMIDFAIYDLEVEKPITLLRKNIRLSSEVLVNPLTVFANYIFDTVSHDSFAVHEKKLYELLLTLSTEEQNIKNGRPIVMEKISVDYSVHEAKSKYYADPAIDDILEIYKTSLNDTSFLVPIGSLRAIKLLKKLSNNKLFIISTDKGYSALESLENLGHPSIAFHGSFSMMVNFHAIANFFKNTGGDYFLQTPRKGIKTSVFCDGFQLKDFPTTALTINECLEKFSPSDYFTLHRRMSDSFPECDIDTLAAHMQLSDWDPHIFSRLSGRITSLVDEADSETIQYLANNMAKIAENYYYMPKSDCILFEIGVFFHAIKHYKSAFEYYSKALPIVGEQFGIYYNMALCLHHIDRNQEALEMFKNAKRMDAESKETDEWIAYLEKHLAEPPAVE